MKIVEQLNDQMNSAEKTKKQSKVGLYCFGAAALLAAYKAIECAYNYGVSSMHSIWCENMEEAINKHDEE